MTYTIDNVSVKEYLGQEVVPGSGCGSWLFESQSTNLVSYSSDFSNAAWSIGGATTIVSDNLISPDGTLNADKLVENNTFNSFSARYSTSISYTSGLKYTTSIFAKSDNRNLMIRSYNGSSDIDTIFDLSNGTVLSGSTGEIKDYGNGWYRCSHTITAQSTINTPYSASFVLVNGSSYLYQGDGTSGVYIYGAQVEANNISSYIPTNGSTVTRNQDVCNNGGSLASINSTEGTLYFEGSALDWGASANNQISLSDGSGSNRIMIYPYSENQLGLRFNANASQLVSQTITVSILSVNFKIAIRWGNGNYSIYQNGLEAYTQSISSTPLGLSKLNFSSVTGGSNFYGKTKALAVWPEALSDQELADLTYPTPTFPTFTLDFNTIADQFTFARGSEATYVDAQGLIQSTASNNAPRLDYSTGAEAFLLETQSTNLVTYSSDFSQIENYNSTITINNNVSPDGNINGNLWLANATASAKELQELYTVTNGTTYTESWFVKYKSQQFIQLVTTSATFGTFYGNFDLINGTKESGNFTDFSIEPYLNGWYRISATQQATSSGSGRLAGLRMINSATAPRGGNITTNGTEAIEVWGHQSEASSYATSYIPSEGSQTTRNQETCSNATPEINSEEGVLYFEGSALADDGTDRKITLSDGSLNNTVTFGFSRFSGNINAEVISGGVLQTSGFGDTGITQTNSNKFALSWGGGTTKFYVNGTLASSHLSVTSPIGLSVLNFSLPTSGHRTYANTKDLQVYTKALSDAELIKLTTI